jgi:hypothetical protein
MFELLELLLGICLWKKSPANMPYSKRLWQLLIIIDIAVTFLVLKLQNPPLAALLQAILGIILISLFAAISLLVAGKLNRFYQTSMALIGTDALIGFCALPTMATISLGHNNLLVLLSMIAIMIWQWLVIGHIMRTSLNQNLGFCLGLAFLYLLGAYSMAAWLFPSVAGITQ